MEKQTIAVLGPGSWGTALSQVLNDNGHEVRIWGNVPEQINEINTHHTNKHYFKDVVLDKNISAYTDLADALKDVDAILFVVPTKVTRLVAQQVAQTLNHKVVIMHASKGLEPDSHKRLSTILEEEIPEHLRSEIVVVSGPSHAEETIVRDLTLITAASKNLQTAQYVQELFSNHYFRLYTNTDVIGVETAGALKNIIAVGAGALHGLGFGDNAKAAIIARGLAEITRLGVALGASPLTYSGLSGVGDLIVTGTSIHSRNWRAGDALGRGESLTDIEANMGMVIEGISTTKAAYELAQELGVYMPITQAIYQVIYHGTNIKDAAGLGTRFLPATKALAKEMLPIVDKPTIQFIVEEALKSGIEDILVVTGKSKRSIEDHFDSNFELEYNLKEKGKHDLLKLVDETTGIRLHFIRQSHPRGLGDAVLQAKAFVGNEPFMVMLGDDLMDITDEDAIPLTRQLMNDYENTHASTIAVMPVPHDEVSAYGVIAPQGEGINGLYSVETFVEKPAPEDAPSDLAIIGRYLLTPEIFDILENQAPGAGNEIQLTDAIDTLNKTQRVFAREFKGARYDVGDKFGFMKTSIDYALKHPQVKDDLKNYLIELGKELVEEE